MSTRVKICGIIRLEDAQLAVELGATALGFNFYPPSPRYIAPASARRIVGKLPPFVVPVGVFADETEDEHVAGIAEQAGVSVVQMHGPRFPAFRGPLSHYRLVRAVAVKDGFNPKSLEGLRANAFLLDTFDAKRRGGTGKTFDWSLAREAKNFGTIILAGGLTPENVREAIRAVRPFAVDVASGVESAPGVKDPNKLRTFFQEVQKVDRELGNESGN